MPTVNFLLSTFFSISSLFCSSSSNEMYPERSEWKCNVCSKRHHHPIYIWFHRGAPSLCMMWCDTLNRKGMNEDAVRIMRPFSVLVVVMVRRIVLQSATTILKMSTLFPCGISTALHLREIMVRVGVFLWEQRSLELYHYHNVFFLFLCTNICAKVCM